MFFKKKPRIIFNDDNCTLTGIPKPHNLDRVSLAVEYFEKTQVDCLCWFVASGVAYSYQSKIIENLWDIVAACKDPGVGDYDKLPMYLHRKGIDYLPRLIEETRKRKINFFASFRMNDTHHKSSPDGALASRFWQQHQEWRLWEVRDGSTYYNAALDYSKPEVRSRYLASIKEFCKMYQPDGIELDFSRNPYLLQPSEAVKKRGIITAFVKKIREHLNKKASVKPLGLIIRMPFDEDVLARAGIDVKEWIRLKLMDALIMTDFTNNLNRDISPWLKLCRKKGILFYPATEAGPAICNDRFNYEVPVNPLASANKCRSILSPLQIIM
ncbi:MAG: glycoside hydrolase family 10 protein [Planctomycetota bacterium]|jgi:uncharacterized lipoprotein YddW (UPF0748 family)